MKLMKIKIINWMYINDVTIDIHNNAVLIGQNASGKTTIIDALQYVITGSTRDSKFNSAQGASTRTLESYVRGNVGSKEKQYLRDGDVISYILIQLEDGEDLHVFGVAIEYTNRIYEKRFYIENLEIEDNWFVSDENKYKSYNEFKSGFTNEQFSYFDTVGTYQNKVRDVMGLNVNSNYFKLLAKALQLKSLDNINEFISSFLLETEEVDITDLQNVIGTINKLRKSIGDNKDKKDLLDEINELGIKVEDLIVSEDYLNSKLVLSSFKQKTDLKESVQKNIHTLRETNNTLNAELETFTDNVNTLNENIRKYEDDLRDEYPDASKHKLDIDRLNSEIERNNDNIKELNTYFSNDINLLKSFDNENHILKELNSLYRNRNKYSKHEMYNKFENYKTTLTKESFGLENTIGELNKEETNYTKDIELTNKRLRNLRRGIQDYPSNTNRLVELIKKDLYDIYSEDIEVKPVSEYLNITDQSYSDAIEGYLNTNRFNIIVPPKYFKDALKTYHRHSRDIFGVTLVDTNKLESHDIVEGTLAEFIESDNINALNYIRMLLNRVYYVDDVLDLPNYRTAITKDCMFYNNYGVRKIRPDIYRVKYIGKAAIENNIKLEEKELERLTGELSTIRTEKQSLSNLVNMYESLETLNNIDIVSLEHYSQLIVNTKALDEVKRIYEAILKDNKYLDISENISRLKNELRIINDKQAAIRKNIERNSLNVANDREKLQSLNDEIEVLKEILENISEHIKVKVENEIADVNITNKYIGDIELEIRNIEKRKIRNITKLEEKMKGFNFKYNSPYLVGINHLKSYQIELAKIDESQFEMESQLTSLRVDFNKMVSQDFLSKVNTNINNIQNTINGVNQKLKENHFGGNNERYKIVAQPSLDPTFNELYDIARRNDVRNRTLLNREKSDEDLQRIEFIINKYMDDKSYLNIHDILDVRKYFSFDVEVKSDNTTKHLSEVLKTQSGGEIQTPFYILITAAFEQTKDIRRKDNNLSIVLFDEAFSNMDPQRIGAMLNYYEKFNIQTIISVPSKLEALGSYVNTALGVVRKGETTHVININKDYKENTFRRFN